MCGSVRVCRLLVPHSDRSGSAIWMEDSSYSRRENRNTEKGFVSEEVVSMRQATSFCLPRLCCDSSRNDKNGEELSPRVQEPEDVVSVLPFAKLDSLDRIKALGHVRLHRVGVPCLGHDLQELVIGEEIETREGHPLGLQVIERPSQPRVPR
jgi:hypothetical protein